jgi:hypothetical protein
LGERKEENDFGTGLMPRSGEKNEKGVVKAALPQAL